MANEKDGNEIGVPFVFVRHGDPLPLDWMARHPGWVKFPATLVPRPVPRRVVSGKAWDVAGAGDAFGHGPTSRPVSVGAPVVQRRRVPVHRLPTGHCDPEDPMAAYLRISKATDAAMASYGMGEQTRVAAPRALPASTEGLLPLPTVVVTAVSAGDGTAQAQILGGMVGGLAASNAGNLWAGTGVLDIASVNMASPGLVGSETSSGMAAPTNRLDFSHQFVQYNTTDGYVYGGKVNRQMLKRGWTEQKIDDAVQNGWRIDAINRLNGNPAT